MDGYILTPREREITQLILLGKTNKTIANLLGISEGTVKKILYNTYKKLGIKSRLELSQIMTEH